MCWKKDGRAPAAAVDAASCATAQIDPPASGSAARIANISCRGMGFLGGMADCHAQDNAAALRLLTAGR
jgi:hypothetical protein